MSKGTRNLTKTIKKRTIYVYLPSEDLVGKWKERADKDHLSLSKFVIEQVNRGIQRGEQEDEFGKTKYELFKELDETKKELDKAHENIRFLEVTINRLEKEMEKYRLEQFTFPIFHGVRHNPEKVINAIRANVPNDFNLQYLLDELQITREETDMVNGVSKHIESLIRQGLVLEVKRGKGVKGGWKWLG